ncbi:CRISPR-associated protein Cas4 [Vulcanisaeta sp. JCM 16161]|uniref:CRISPR-associated protein Cas4 n=1 Tax=Vulcanisaeta sp. JCM 16161 TaxID=1295372 RepID=UPI00406D4912
MDYIPISMVKEYVYCPRQAYLKLMTMKEPPTESMKYAKQLTNTENITKTIKEQGIQGEIKLEVPVKSTSLGIVGRVDAIAINGNRATIIETKLNIGNKKKLYTKYNHVLAQVMAYTIAVEETMKTTVDKIIIINQEKQTTITIKPTPNLKTWIKRTIQEMKKHIQNQELPPKTTNKAKCKTCHYKNICPP